MFKKLIVALSVLVALGATVVSPAVAEVAVSGDVYATVADKYLWRGFDLSPEASFVVQPGMDVSLGSVTFSYWSNFDEDLGKLNETDITLDYSVDLNELVSLSVGNIYYALDALEDTNELYLSASFNVLLSPSVAIYWDWDEADEAGLYLTAGIGHTFAINDTMGLNLGAQIAYNGESDFAIGDYSDFHNAEFSASVDIEAAKGFVISPAVVVSVPLSDDAEDIAGIDEEIMVGVTCVYSF